jgi:type VI secretion system ImpA family protein
VPGKLTPADFQKSVLLTSTDFLSVTAAEVERAMEACSAVESILDRRCGKGGPSLRQLWNVMESIHASLASWLAQRPSVEEEEVIGYSPVSTPAYVPQDEPVRLRAGAIRSREEAYLRLSEAAEYLARTEPHSPAPYLVRRAVAWGSLSLSELLPELVRGDSELAEIFRLLRLEKGNPAK